jgi:thioredoxin 1
MPVLISELTDRTFDQAVRSRIPVLIDFWGDDCVPCKMMEPIIEEIKSRYQGKVTVVKANIKNCTKVVEQYKVMSIPTLMLFKDGKPVEKITGVVRETALNKLLSSSLS